MFQTLLCTIIYVLFCTLSMKLYKIISIFDCSNLMFMLFFSFSGLIPEDMQTMLTPQLESTCFPPLFLTVQQPLNFKDNTVQILLPRKNKTVIRQQHQKLLLQVPRSSFRQFSVFVGKTRLSIITICTNIKIQPQMKSPLFSQQKHLILITFLMIHRKETVIVQN